MGADIVAAEGQSLGNALNFGGPYVGLFATPRKIRAADAGAAGRRDRRCRRPARLGADPVDPRAAHPPREGDEQYLHQFRPVRARLHDPPGAARRSRADPAGAAQPRDRGRARRAARRDPRRATRQPELLQRIRAAAAASGGASRRGAGRARAFSPACRSAASIRTATISPICCWSRRPRLSPRTISTGSNAGLREVLSMSELEPGAERPPGSRRARPDRDDQRQSRACRSRRR